MSNKYEHGDHIPTEVLCKRADELVDVLTKDRHRMDAEFTMRIPAELDRDADLVIDEISRRLTKHEATIKEKDVEIESLQSQHDELKRLVKEWKEAEDALLTFDARTGFQLADCVINSSHTKRALQDFIDQDGGAIG